MLRSLYNKYCHGYQELQEHERMPLRPMTSPQSRDLVTTQQPAGYQRHPNRWYPQQDDRITREIVVMTNNPGPEMRAHYGPPTYPALPGGFMCYTQSGGYTHSLHYTTPYQYYYQQSVIQGRYTEQGRVICNSLNPGAQVFCPQAPYNGVTQAPYNGATQGPPNHGAQGPHNPGAQGPYNPYFDVNNIRYQLSNVSRHGPGNPFLTQQHLKRSSLPADLIDLSEMKCDQQTNTSLNLTSQTRSRDMKSRDIRSKSRDKNTATNLVLGAKKRRQRTAVHRPARLMEYARAAPGAERAAETQIRDSVETVMAELRERGEVVLEIKVGNSEELIKDSMRESPETPLSDVTPVSRDVTALSRDDRQLSEATSLTVLEDVTYNTNSFETSPTQRTAIEDVLAGVPSQPEVTSQNSSPVTPVSPTNSTAVTPVSPTNSTAVTPVSPTNSTAVTPVSPTNSTAVTPTSPSKDTTATPMSPAESSPMTPLSQGFEWCDEYEYEMVDEGEGEEEAALRIDLEFDLDSPEKETCSNPDNE